MVKFGFHQSALHPLATVQLWKYKYQSLHSALMASTLAIGGNLQKQVANIFAAIVGAFKGDLFQLSFS